MFFLTKTSRNFLPCDFVRTKFCNQNHVNKMACQPSPMKRTVLSCSLLLSARLISMIMSEGYFIFDIHNTWPLKLRLS